MGECTKNKRKKESGRGKEREKERKERKSKLHLMYHENKVWGSEKEWDTFMYSEDEHGERKRKGHSYKWNWQLDEVNAGLRTG